MKRKVIDYTYKFDPASGLWVLSIIAQVGYAWIGNRLAPLEDKFQFVSKDSIEACWELFQREELCDTSPRC